MYNYFIIEKGGVLTIIKNSFKDGLEYEV